MSLPINIRDLIHGHSVEWERLEFKQGWNPEDVVHTMCAFANDLNNWGGGYIVIGIKANNGISVLPPLGLQQNQLDALQNEVLNLGNRIQPAYLPIMHPYTLDGRHILVLWCPAGDFRPYSAPSTLGDKAQRQYYIRSGSSTVIARNETLRRLFELAARVPFDDRINQQATIDDFDLTLIQAYLHEVKSDLYEESKNISLANLARNMHIVKGSDEYLRPVNAGLLFFSREPEKFFDRSWIEVVWHKDDVGDNFTEHYFKGALYHQLRDALSFIKTNIIHEHVIKVPSQAEALRFYNYPYEAVEEALSNAVYHKGYDLGKPIEVQIFTDKITVLSYPGAMPPVDTQILHHQKIVARDYRNRRIGDFLKELNLTEGRGTGFPKMNKKMENNGSPQPIIETDELGVYFMVTLPINSLYWEYVNGHDNDQVGDQVNNLSINSLEEIIAISNGDSDQAVDQVSDQANDIVSDKVKTILKEHLHNRVEDILKITNQWIKRGELFNEMNLSNHPKHRKKYLDPLLKIDWVEMEFPDKKTSPNQRYRITASGKKILSLIRK
ncbi:MAG: putative DNA binding domain-containing protein [Prevotellaceae bacterium]|jgi:ATP-dependent DNA helicase RecG|nr:putative DNA binding domain-containing protein [Prevotellaceae bacterium]